MEEFSSLDGGKRTGKSVFRKAVTCIIERRSPLGGSHAGTIRRWAVSIIPSDILERTLFMAQYSIRLYNSGIYGGHINSSRNLYT